MISRFFFSSFWSMLFDLEQVAFFFSLLLIDEMTVFEQGASGLNEWVDANFV